MKKLIILLIAAFFVTGLSAQNSKRTSAFNYFKNGKLDKAKALDITILGEEEFLSLTRED